MRKVLPLAILTFLAALACIFSNFRNADADSTLQLTVERDHATLELVVNYLIKLQEKGVLPNREQADK